LQKESIAISFKREALIISQVVQTVSDEIAIVVFTAVSLKDEVFFPIYAQNFPDISDNVFYTAYKK
jgi:hypothetical protein